MLHEAKHHSTILSGNFCEGCNLFHCWSLSTESILHVRKDLGNFRLQLFDGTSSLLVSWLAFLDVLNQWHANLLEAFTNRFLLSDKVLVFS